VTGPSNDISTEGILTAQEAAAYLRVPLQTIYDWVHGGKLPAQRAGRLLRFRRSELDAWLNRDNNLPASA
jgi:excisionase family DNA binding protein